MIAAVNAFWLIPISSERISYPAYISYMGGDDNVKVEICVLFLIKGTLFDKFMLTNRKKLL